MSSIKIHPILSFLFFFTLTLLPFCSSAINQVFTNTTGDDDVVGYLNIKTPNDEPYRVYEIDIYVSMVQPSPCTALPSTPTKTLKFDENKTKIDLISGTQPITEGMIEAMDGGFKLPWDACLQIVTYHNDNHTGNIPSNKVLIPAASAAFAVKQPFNLELDLH